MPELNPETKKVMTEGEHLKNLVSSQGWHIVRRKFTEKMIAIGDIFQLTDKDNLKEELGARQIAIETLKNTIAEIEGSAAQYENNSQFFRQIQEDAYIHREKEE